MLSILLFFAACSHPAEVLGLPSTAQASGTDTVVTWSGGTLTLGDLNQAAEAEFSQLKIEYLQNRHELMKQTANRLIIDSILEKEAAAAGMETDPWLEQQVVAQVGEPTEEDLLAFHARYGQHFGDQPLDAVRAQLTDAWQQQSRGEAAQGLLAELMDKHKVHIDLPYPDLPRIPMEGAGNPSKGPADAPITIIEFAEYQCPYCGKAGAVMEQLLAEYKDQIQVVFRDFPLQFHDRAIPAAVAANCAGAQDKYWAMHDILMANQGALQDIDLEKYAFDAEVDMDTWRACVADPEPQVKEIMADMEAGTKAGVTGTPAFFVNGIFLSGALPYDSFKEIIDRELSEK
jgi:predicted DsbA family dithiol-disulfide isomerase